MQIITETLRHQQLASSFLLNGNLNVQRLRESAQVYIHAMAWTATRGTTNALQVIEQHADHEPNNDELAERIHPIFGWREVVEWAAYLALKNRLEADLAAEIRLIQTSMTFATITGRRVVGIIPIRAGDNPPAASDLTVVVQRDSYPEAVWLDLELIEDEDDDVCPKDGEGLHFPCCGCDR